MSLNCTEINIILDELRLEGSFIQKIVQPGFDSIALYTYKEGRAKTVYISLAPGACRINETRKAVPKNEKPLRFMEFLKSRIKGAKITSCCQIGLERCIKMELGCDGKVFFLFVRLWSNSSNIVLTDENLVILDCFFRRPKRGEVSGKVFVPPQIREDAKVFEARTFDEVLKQGQNDGTSQAQDGTPSALSYNEKVDLYYSEHAESLGREALLEQAQKLYGEHKARMENALKKLEEKRNGFLESEKLKHQGDLILAFGHLYDGGDFLECEDYDTGKTVRIPFDCKKSVQENARVAYEKYKKAASGLEQLEYDISKAKKEILDLDAVYESILKEPNPIKIQQMIRRQTKPKQQIAKKRPGLAYEISGWTIFVGRDAGENDELLRHHVKGQDMWMHTRDFAGGYVFIKARAGKTIPLEILLNCGNLAVHHSKARKQGQADLYYTQVKYLRRAKNGPKGLVLPTNEKNLSVKIDNERLRVMEEHQVQ